MRYPHYWPLSPLAFNPNVRPAQFYPPLPPMRLYREAGEMTISDEQLAVAEKMRRDTATVLVTLAMGLAIGGVFGYAIGHGVGRGI